MRKVLGWLYQVYAWLVVYPLGWGLTLATAIITAVMSMAGFAESAHRFVAANWARLVLWVTPVKVSIDGLEHVRTDTSYVIICNHQSTYDVLVIYGWLPVSFRWVIKQELRKMPFVGFACLKLGHIFVDRRNKAAAAASIRKAKESIPTGVSVVFFPEGTRNSKQSLLPFKKGAFRLAKELGWPILPVSIKGADKVLSTQSLKITPGHIELIFHTPIQRDEYEKQTMQELVQNSRETIARGADMSF